MQNRTKIGNGKTAEVFEYGAGKVCKLFQQGYPAQYVKFEKIAGAFS